MSRTFQGFVGIGSTLLLSSCGVSWLTEPKTNPIIEDRMQVAGREPLGTFATTAERRVVLVSGRREDNESLTKNFGKFCAEPPADVAESVSASFQGALAAAANQPTGISAQGSAELARQISTAVQTLAQRSQGVIVFRDGSYQLCAMVLNEFISTDEFSKKWDELLSTSKELISKEIEESGGRIGHPPSNLNAPELAAITSLLVEYYKNRPELRSEKENPADKPKQAAPAPS